MESTELRGIEKRLKDAGSPEEVFGTLTGDTAEQLVAGRKIFLRLASVVHPDKYQGTSDEQRAGEAFKRLVRLWEAAQQRIQAGVYGKFEKSTSFTPFSLRGPRYTYTVERILARGDLCNLYTGSLVRDGKRERVLLKIPLMPQDNDLQSNEARILRHLQSGEHYTQASPFISRMIDSFSYKESATGIVRQITVLSYTEGLYTLSEIKEAYPEGIDPKDMAWMWRRLLVALDFAHSNKVIHGCVLPTHILIHPEQHGVVLIDWAYAALDPQNTHEWISAISSPYRAWYPPEIFARAEPQPGLDFFMAAKCMIELLGGEPLPSSVPWQIHNHLKGCMLPQPDQRPRDARALLKDFDELLERQWGPRRFHAFSMPRR